MNKNLRMVLSTGLMCGATLCANVYADDSTMAKPMMNKDMMNKDMMNKDMMKTMDTNGDGWISREEYNNFHAMRWEHMKKNKDGMVDMKDMGNDAMIRGDRNPPAALQDSLKK